MKDSRWPVDRRTFGRWDNAQNNEPYIMKTVTGWQYLGSIPVFPRFRGNASVRAGRSGGVTLPTVSGLERRRRLLLAFALVAGGGAVALVSILCLISVVGLRDRVYGISSAVRIERQAANVIDQVGNGLIAFTATSIDDITPAERARILDRTDLALAEMQRSIAAFQAKLTTLPVVHQQRFATAIASITRNWQELRSSPDGSLPATQRAQYFRRILDDMQVVRACLWTLLEDVAAHTTQETKVARSAIRDTIARIGFIIGLAGAVGGFGAFLARHYLVMPRRANDRLAKANAELATANATLMEAKQKAEEGSRSKSEFLSAFSHELRTPLNAIIGFSNLLREPSGGSASAAERQEYIEQINSSGQHLLNLINDILDYSKAGAGKLQLAESQIGLGRTVVQVAAMFRVRCAAAGLALVLDVDEAPVMLGDERRVKQILINLLSNAVKFTPAGGTITLRAAVEAGAPVLSVRDSGIGIAKQDLPRVMERFGQVDSSLSRRYQGTGLGLPLVATMAELHGGRLRIESDVGKGTLAIVSFPPTRLSGMERRYGVAA